jgi:hypothetical protein
MFKALKAVYFIHNTTFTAFSLLVTTHKKIVGKLSRCCVTDHFLRKPLLSRRLT